MNKVVLLLAACMLLSPGVHANDEGDAPEIRRLGFFPFLKRMVDHPLLRSAFDDAARENMLRTFGQLKDAKPKHVRGRVVRAVAPVEFRFSLVEYEEIAFLLVLTGAQRDGSWQPFGIRVCTVNDPSNLVGEIAQFYRYLPKYDMDRSLVEGTGTALREAATAQDYAIVDQYISRLADDAGGLPAFMRFDEAGRQRFTSRANALMKQLNFKPEVSYLGARSLTDNFFMAAFTADTKLGPAVNLLFFYIHEGKPVIVSGQVQVGARALAFLPDMQKPEKVAGGKKD